MEIIQQTRHSTISIPTSEKPLFRLSHEILEQASSIKRLSNVPEGLSFLKDPFSAPTMSKSEAPKLVAENIKENVKKTKEVNIEEVWLSGLWKRVTLEDRNIDTHLGVL